MPGNDTPDAVRFELFKGFQHSSVRDNDNSVLVPCMAHGDFVKVESLQADHLQAKTEIIKRQKELVKELNDRPKFAEEIMKFPGMSKFFVKAKMKDDTEEHYYGTYFFMSFISMMLITYG